MLFTVFGFGDIGWWLSGVWFLVAFLLTSFLPGRTMLQLSGLRPRLSQLETCLLSSALGIISWTAQGWLLGWVQLRWLSYAWIAVWGVLALRSWLWQWMQVEPREILKHGNKISLLNLAVFAVLLLGSSIQVVQVISSGMRYHDGISFFRVNADDGMLHLSFIASMVRSFPPQQPGAVGLSITNYHYWSDFYLAELIRVFGLPITHTFFQFMPIVLSLGSGLAVIAIMQRWSKAPLAPLFGLIWLYFAGDLIYVFALALNKGWGFEMSAIDNSATQLLNIPHSFAKALFLIGLLPLTEWLKTKDWRWGALGIFIHAPLISFKVYFGLFAAIIWTITGLWSYMSNIWQHRKKVRTIRAYLATWFILGIVFMIVTAALYIPVNKNAGGLFYSPLEWPKLFLGQSNLDWREWWLRKQVYEAANNWKGIVVFDAIAIAICLACVYGTRVIGWWPGWGKQSKLPASLRWALYAGSIAFTLLGLYTLQESGLFNVFNFLAVAALPLALFAALVSAEAWQKGWMAQFLIVAMIVLSAPRMLHHASQATMDILAYRPRITISPAEENLLNTIRTERAPTEILQSHPENLYDQNPPYTSFFTNRQTYLTGTGMMKSHNQPIADREVILEELFKTNDSVTFIEGLKNQQISIVYLRNHPSEKLPFDLKTAAGIELLVENEAGQVWHLTP